MFQKMKFEGKKKVGEMLVDDSKKGSQCLKQIHTVFKSSQIVLSNI